VRDVGRTGREVLPALQRPRRPRRCVALRRPPAIYTENHCRRSRWVGASRGRSTPPACAGLDAIERLRRTEGGPHPLPRTAMGASRSALRRDRANGESPVRELCGFNGTRRFATVLSGRAGAWYRAR
jgi:hypothetical protein